MPSLISFSICCPFFPPNSLFNALLTCTSVRELRMTDTPLYISMIPKSPPEFVIERLYLIPVAEAPRVGQSPYEARYSSPEVYHSREYRKKYKNDILARYAASAFLFDVGKPTSLTHVQVSGDLCTLDEFAQHDWPRLQSLVMTGHPPRQTGTELVDVISKMPKLKELRLLFAKSAARGDAMFKVLPAAPEYTSAKGNHGSLLAQIESFAVSDACILDRVGYFMKGVERLAILAISGIADPAVAFTKRVLQKMLREVSAAGTPAPKTIPPKPQSKHHGKHMRTELDSEPVSTRPEVVHKNRTLKHLRVMLGEMIEPDFCKFLADRFPKIEVLEVEKCGYYDGRDVAPWSAYVDNLKPIRRTLRSLRLGMQFEEQEPLHDCTPHKAHACAPINDDFEHPTATSSPTPSWRLEREKCAHYFAQRLGQLTRAGFEYRKRPGPHRIDDRWLDWEIERRISTPEMRKDWEVRREAKLTRLAEERNIRREERRMKIEQEEREREERKKKLEEERKQNGVGTGEERYEEGDDAPLEDPISRSAATVSRRTSTATTSTATTNTSVTTTPSTTTPSLTTPLSHPSSTHNLAQQMYLSNAGTGYPSYRQSPPLSNTSAGGSYPMSSPESSTSLSSPTTTTAPNYPPQTSTSSSHRVSSSLGGGITSPTNVGGGNQQDYFMNFRASSTYTEYSSLNQQPSYHHNQQPSSSTGPFSPFSNISTGTPADPPPPLQEEEEDAEINEEEIWDSDDEDPEGILGIYELKPSWYPFPECWRARTLWEEEEVADSGGTVVGECEAAVALNGNGNAQGGGDGTAGTDKL
ncbi:hypothetical protein AN958_07278 [Leucoagaricus sp. SymC.cos]|nr:hypothetical protein AN958_07278 [Leucoagaricus sp. SymC.cos]